MTTRVDAPLKGVRVLDLSRMFAAPWAAQLLGDLGAEVIKIERPGRGDEMRHYGPPFLKDREGNDLLETAYSLAANRNKRSITVDLANPEGQCLIHRLAKISDVFIENYKVGNLARFGLDYASVKATNPNIIYCSITGFGQDGPYANRPGVDTIFQAMSGMMSITGEADGPPQKVGLVIVDLITGLYAAVGALAALRNREVQGGPGQHIDLALLDSAMATMSHRAMEFFISDVVPQRKGTASAGNVPARNFECRDGAICVQAGGEEQFRKLCRAIEKPELAEDPRFVNRRARIANEADLIPLLDIIFASKPVAEWMEILTDGGIYCGPYYDVKQAFDDPHVVSRKLKREAPHAATDHVPLIANPLRFSETPIDDFQAPPLLGQHTEEILRDLLGVEGAELQALRDRGVV